MEKKEVDLKFTFQFYSEPDKAQLKAIQKAVSQCFEMNSNFKKIVAGIYVDNEKGITPEITIGISLQRGFEDYPVPVFKSLGQYLKNKTNF